MVEITNHGRRLHPLPLRIMHWVNAVTIFIMVGSGWKIYNDEVMFGWLHFPEGLTIGKWAQHGLQWHFFGMWILVINGLCYLTYGLVSGRFRRMLLPIRWSELIATVKDTLHFKLVARRPDKIQRGPEAALCRRISCIGILIVISGLAIWKPIQFSELVALFGSFQNARLVHFLLHDGDRAVRGRARHACAAGAADPCRHVHRRPAVDDQRPPELQHKTAH